MRWTVAIGTAFDDAGFANAFDGFRKLYHVRPERVLCAPDVLVRFAEIYSRSADDAHEKALAYEAIPLAGAIIAPGTIVFEGDVDEERMGDW